MKHIICGWTVGLTDRNGRTFFLGRHRTAEGVWYANTQKNPLSHDVYSALFDTPDEAMDFWKNCYYENLDGKDSYTPIPVKIDLSVEVSGLGFEWNGIQIHT